MRGGSTTGCHDGCLHKLAACDSAWPHRDQQGCQSSTGDSLPDVTPRWAAAAGSRPCNPSHPQEAECPTKLLMQG